MKSLQTYLLYFKLRFNENLAFANFFRAPCNSLNRGSTVVVYGLRNLIWIREKSDRIDKKKDQTMNQDFRGIHMNRVKLKRFRFK